MKSKGNLKIAHSNIDTVKNLVDQLFKLQQELRYIDSVLTQIDVSQDDHTRRKIFAF